MIKMIGIVASAAVLCLVSGVAFAQQATPSEYNLKLAPVEVDMVGEALMELPAKKAMPLMQKIRQQVIEQQTLKPTPKPDPNPEPPK